MDIREPDLSGYSDSGPGKPVHLLFIHHPAGGELMANPGKVSGESGIYRSHPNGGGLRALLSQSSYVVHEASVGSAIGMHTEICHWHQTFRSQMRRILATKHQDTVFADGSLNRVVMFQSGPEVSRIHADGTGPGRPDSPGKTVPNYKAAYRSLLRLFQQEPQTLFIALTAAPLQKPQPEQGFFGRILGRQGDADVDVDGAGKRIRAFNNWLKSIHSGWLCDYPLNNVVVFDYYDVLTAHGISNWLRYPSEAGKECRPDAKGNTLAAREFIPFVNRAFNRLSLSLESAANSGQRQGFSRSGRFGSRS
jgi:hypothetical protein